MAAGDAKHINGIRHATDVETLDSLLKRTRYDRWSDENTKRRRTAEELQKASAGRLGRYEAEKQADEKH
ncbi:MAG: hypothetical protein EBX36_10990, partial [Planctomycetia bacterium]|nr:hypothetical protein [Planctomycetia bacterium]